MLNLVLVSWGLIGRELETRRRCQATPCGDHGLTQGLSWLFIEPIEDGLEQIEATREQMEDTFEQIEDTLEQIEDTLEQIEDTIEQIEGILEQIDEPQG